jgi:hypothetical protein
MADPQTVSPEAADILVLMVEAWACLPDDWETNGFWLAGVQSLAQFIADSKDAVPADRLGTLLSIGGKMIHMAHAEQVADAGKAAADIIERVRRNGGAA